VKLANCDDSIYCPNGQSLLIKLSGVRISDGSPKEKPCKIPVCREWRGFSFFVLLIKISSNILEHPQKVSQKLVKNLLYFFTNNGELQNPKKAAF